MLIRRFFRLHVGWLLALLALWPATLHALGPFDHNTRVWVFDDHLDVTVTMGPEAAKIFLNHGPAEVLSSGHMEIAFPLPPASAARIFEIKTGDTVLAPQQTTVRSDGLDYIFGLFYTRPDVGTLRCTALYLGETATRAKGSLVVVDEAGSVLAAKILAPENNLIDFVLPPRAELVPVVQAEPATHPADPVTNEPSVVSAATSPAPKPPVVAPSFGEFLKLGVEHILTGYDHLLFLCALLIGLRKLGPMLAVITCFTLAHSVTLALAAANVVAISSRIVEPIIAASIIVVGLENLWRREATRDRYWLAGGFGLIHGFGFASVLRETGLGLAGTSIALPLFSFNLGVELGQLLVMAIVVPLLFLLRRWPLFARYGTPAVATLVILLSGYWFLERTVFYR